MKLRHLPGQLFPHFLTNLAVGDIATRHSLALPCPVRQRRGWRSGDLTWPPKNRMEHHQFCLQTDDNPTRTYMNWVRKQGPQIGTRLLLNRSLWGFVGFEAKPERCDLLQVLQSIFPGNTYRFSRCNPLCSTTGSTRLSCPIWQSTEVYGLIQHLAFILIFTYWFDFSSCIYITCTIQFWWTMYVTGSPKTIRFGWSKFSINAAAMDFRLGSHPSMYPSHPMASAYLRTELSRSSGINFQRILKLREEQNCPVPSGLSVTWKSWNVRKFLLQSTPKIDAWSKFDLRFWGLDSKPQIKL